MKQSPATTRHETHRSLLRTLLAAPLLGTPAAFASEHGPHTAPGETGLWFIGLMAVFVAVIFAGFWLHARDERPPSTPEREREAQPSATHGRPATWQQRQGEPR